MKEKLSIVKVPDKDANNVGDIRHEFESMPRMYLELFENKEKIKYDAPKEYDPADLDKIDQSILEYPKVVSDVEDNDDPPSDYEYDKDLNRSKSEDYSSSKRDDESSSKRDDDYYSSRRSGDDYYSSRDKYKDDDYYSSRDKYKDDDYYSSRDKYKDDDYSSRDKYKDDDYSSRRRSDDYYSSRDKYKDDDYYYSSRDKDDYSSRDKESPSSKYAFESKYSPSQDEKKDNDLNSRLIELLQNDDSDDEGNTMKEYNRRSYENYQKVRKDPPKLSEISSFYGNEEGEKPIDTSKEDEDGKKRELLYNMDKMRKSYPKENIPEYSMHTDLATLQTAYDSHFKRITIETNAKDYKQYLIWAFMLVEYGLGYFFKFDMQGFTDQQIKSMDKYERLLIELGEKNYVPDDEQWPVEFRLLGVIIMNTAVFLIGKQIAKKTGADILNFVQNMNIANDPVNTNTAKPKRRMRGPQVDLSGL